MAVDPVGAVLGVAGLIAAFKGAVDGYVLIESFFKKDSSLQDLACRFHVEQHRLSKWGERFQLKNGEECLLQYEN